MCDSLLTHLSSVQCINYFLDNTKKKESNKLKEKLLECTMVSMDSMESNIESQIFIIKINKFCSSSVYNKSIINDINTKFESLLNLITIDPELIKFVKSNDDEFYIKLFNCLNTNDVLKVFKHLDPNKKTIRVCQNVIRLNYNCIKYIDDILNENLCDIAMAYGHANLDDIKNKARNESICKKYIKINKNNISFLNYKSNLSTQFFINLLMDDIDNIKLITDPYCFNSDICSYVVKKNGLYIKHLPIKNQTMRILELAIEQNPIARYYVSYNCFPNTNLSEIQHNVFKSIHLIKTLKNSEMYNDVFDECLLLSKNNLNINSGILINYITDSYAFYAMTGENYLNYQYQLYLEQDYKITLDVFQGSTLVSNVKTNQRLQKSITEFTSSFYDSQKNLYVVFFQFV
jgi:hypothetical protein